MTRGLRPILAVVVGFLLVVHFAPQVLAFPYSVTLGDTKIYSETPLQSDRLATLLARSGAQLRRSPLYGDGYGKRIFLTDGGWRWTLTALRSIDAFAVSIPLTEAIIVNRSSIADDVVISGTGIASRRTLSGVITHERTHGLIRARFGVLAGSRLPNWLIEGYSDYVAGGGSLSDDEARRLIAKGVSMPAVDYYLDRGRVERGLARMSVAQLFEANRHF